MSVLPWMCMTMACVVGVTAVGETDTLDIAPVWAGHPVGFCLLTASPDQFVAYYNAERQMTVAARRLGEREWRFQALDERVAWDSHNSITMALDRRDCLHISGNMHCAPLVYFRSASPRDIASITRLTAMTGDLERLVTYPRFITGPGNTLVFTYRTGRSGNGDQIFNAYDPENRTWRRLLDTPFTNGEGLRNAYPMGPVQGSDGVYHLCWVWREESDCATNHDLSYARSRDLVHWERSDGTPCTLPMTLASAEVVDPVPVGGGIINGNTRLGFDGRGRPVISYHKNDAQGFTQLYVARREEAGWHIAQVSDWDYPWAFSGGGTIVFEIHVDAVQALPDGNLTLGYGHAKKGSGRFLLNGETLERIETLPPLSSAMPADLQQVEGDFPGLQVRSSADLGTAEAPGVRYMLRWETLPANRDKPRPEPWPAPSMLRLLRITE